METKDLNNQEQMNRLRAVVEAIRETLTPNDLDTALAAVVTGVQKVLGEHASAAITLVGSKGELDPDSYQVVGPLAEIMTNEKPRPTGGVGAWVVEHNEAVFEENIAVGEATNHPAIRRGRTAVRAYACLPLPDDRHVIGTLFVLFQTPFHFDDEIRESLISFTSLAARVVELTRLREESERQKKQQIQTIRQISQQLLETWQQSDPINTLEKTLADILRRVDKEVINDQETSAIIYIYEEGEGFSSGVARGPLKDYMARYPPRKGGTGEYTIQTKDPLFVSDVADMSPDVPPLSPLALEQGVKAFANLPLLIGASGQETLVGLLLINLREKYEFDENRRTILRLFADQAAIALQNARVHRRRLREREAIQTISEAVTSGSPDEVSQIIVKQAVELTKSTYATFWSADLEQARLELKKSYQIEPHWRPPKSVLPIDEHSINGHVAQTKMAYYAPNLDIDPHAARWHEAVKAAFCVPLLVEEELIGTLYVASEKESGITPADQDFIKRLAPHAAVALYNARLLEEEHHLRERAEALQAIVTELRATLDLEAVGSTILEQLKRIVPYRTASLQRILSNDQRELFAANGFEINDANPFFTRPLVEDPLICEIISSKHPRILADVNQYSQWTPLEGVNSWAGVPLIVDGKVMGLLTLDHEEIGFYTEQKHAEILTTFANHAALALRNAELYSLEQRRNRDLEVLNQSAIELSKLREAEQVYQAILTAVVDTLESDYCTLFLADADDRLISHASQGRLFTEAPELHLAPGEGLAGWVYQQGEPLLVRNTMQDSRYQLAPWETEIKPRSMILAPLRRGKKIIGVVCADFDRPEAFDESDLRLLDTLTLHAGTILQNIEFIQGFQTLHEAANHLASQPGLEQIYQIAVQFALKMLYCKHSTIFILDKKVGELVAKARVGATHDVLEIGHFRPGEGLAGTVVVTGKSMLVDNAAQDERFIEGKNAPHSAPRSIILAPIKIGDEVIGVISADKDELDGFSEHNLDMLETLALDVGIAIHLRRQQDILQAIAEFQRDISNILPVQAQLERIHEKMSGLMDTSSMFIALYDEDTSIIRFPLVYERGQLIDDTMKVEAGIYTTRRFGIRQGLTEWVIRRKEALLVENFKNWTEGKKEVEEDFRQEVKCCLVVPMLVKDKIIGVIGLQNFDQPDVFDNTDHNLLVTIARQAAIALENARLYDQTRWQVEQLSTLHKIGRKITSTLALDEILESIVADMVELVGARRSLFLLIDTKRHQLTKVTGYNYPSEHLQELTFEEVEAGVSGWVLANKRPVLVTDAQSDPRNTGIALERAKQFDTVPLIVAPLIIRDEVMGTLTAVNAKDDPPFTEDDQRLVIMLADQATIAIDNARQYDLLAQRIAELQAVSQFQQQISTINPVKEELQEIYKGAAKAMRELMDTQDMYIALYDENTGKIEFPLAYKKGRLVPDKEKVEETPFGPRSFGARAGLTEWVIDHKQPLFIEKDFDTRAAEEGIEVFSMDTQCWLGAPMLLRDQVIGVIGLQSFEREEVFNTGHKELLVTIASQAAIAVDNARQYDLINNQLIRRIKELEAISQFQQQISNIDTIERALQDIYDAADEVMSGLMDTRDMYIALYNENTQTIEFPLAYEKGRLVSEEEKKIKGKTWTSRRLGERKGLTEWVIRHKKPLLIEKNFDTWIAAQKDIQAFPLGTKSWLGAPMLLRDQVIGVIGLQNFEQEEIFDKNHCELLVIFASQAAIAIDNAKVLERRIAELEAISRFQYKIVSTGSEQVELQN